MAKKTEKKVTEEVIEKKEEEVVAGVQTITEADVKEEPSVITVAKEVEESDPNVGEEQEVLNEGKDTQENGDDEETEQEDPVVDKKDVEVDKAEEPKVEPTPAPQPQGRKVFHPWNGMLY